MMDKETELEIFKIIMLRRSFTKFPILAAMGRPLGPLTLWGLTVMRPQSSAPREQSPGAQKPHIFTCNYPSLLV